MSICASCLRLLRGRGKPSAADGGVVRCSLSARGGCAGALRPRDLSKRPGGQACGDFGFPQKQRTDLRGAGIGVAGSPRGRGKRMGRALQEGRRRRIFAAPTLREGAGRIFGNRGGLFSFPAFFGLRSRGAAFSATHHTFLQRGPCPAYLFRSGESCTREPCLPQPAVPQGPCVASRRAWPRRGRLLPCLKGMTAIMHRYLLFCRRRRYFACNESFWENRRYGNNRRQDV